MITTVKIILAVGLIVTGIVFETLSLAGVFDKKENVHE